MVLLNLYRNIMPIGLAYWNQQSFPNTDLSVMINSETDLILRNSPKLREVNKTDLPMCSYDA